MTNHKSTPSLALTKYVEERDLSPDVDKEIIGKKKSTQFQNRRMLLQGHSKRKSKGGGDPRI